FVIALTRRGAAAKLPMRAAHRAPFDYAPPAALGPEKASPGGQRNDMASGLEVRRSFDLGSGRTGQLFSLPELEKQGLGAVSRLPASLRIVLESLVRNLDGKRVQEADVRRLAAWKPKEDRTAEVPFVVARVLLQDFTGVPLLVDLAAMR